jgi:c-di-GMP-binding flagellar brake protein YcgR
MGGDPDSRQTNWFAEFKKVNKVSPASSTKSDSTPPGNSKASERRLHHRFEIDECQATLYPQGLLTVFGMSKNNRARAALDLSEGGVRFLIHERLTIGTRVHMVIQMEKYQDQIEARGEVRWCYQSTKKAGDFYAGVEFSDLDAAQKRKIAMMREWFTSPQYRAVRETKRKKSDDFSFPT